MLYEYKCSYAQSHGANGFVVPLIRSFPDMKFLNFISAGVNQCCESCHIALLACGIFFGEKIVFLFSCHVPVFWHISTTHNGSI